MTFAECVSCKVKTIGFQQLGYMRTGIRAVQSKFTNNCNQVLSTQYQYNFLVACILMIYITTWVAISTELLTSVRGLDRTDKQSVIENVKI